MGAGTGQVIAVTFVPDDATEYATILAATAINVVQATPTISVSAPASAVFGQLLTYVAAVIAVGSAPVGTVTFLDGSTSLGSARLDGTGKAMLTISELAVGRHTITARYGGDANELAATSDEAVESILQDGSQVAADGKRSVHQEKVGIGRTDSRGRAPGAGRGRSQRLRHLHG